MLGCLPLRPYNLSNWASSAHTASSSVARAIWGDSVSTHPFLKKTDVALSWNDSTDLFNVWKWKKVCRDQRCQCTALAILAGCVWELVPGESDVGEQAPHLGLDSCFQCDGGAGVCDGSFHCLIHGFGLRSSISHLLAWWHWTSVSHLSLTSHRLLSPPANCGQHDPAVSCWLWGLGDRITAGRKNLALRWEFTHSGWMWTLAEDQKEHYASLLCFTVHVITTSEWTVLWSHSQCTLLIPHGLLNRRLGVVRHLCKTVLSFRGTI